MSDFAARVHEVEGIRQYPTADHLTLVKLKDHDRELVADKLEDGSFRYEPGVSLVVLLPVNAILPRPVLEEMHAWDHAKGKGTLGSNRGNRLTARKFPPFEEGSDDRYESQGAMRPVPFVNEDGARRHFIENEGKEMDVEHGTDVAEFLGITEYVAKG